MITKHLGTAPTSEMVANYLAFLQGRITRSEYMQRTSTTIIESAISDWRIVDSAALAVMGFSL